MNCYQCGSYFDPRNALTYERHIYCPECAAVYFVPCAGCAQPVYCEDVATAEGRHYCSTCYDHLHYCCDDCGREISPAALCRTSDGNYCSTCYDRNFVTCAECGEAVRRYNSYTHRDQFYCADCYSDNFTNCHGCGNTYHRDDLNEDGYCDECSVNQPEWGMSDFVCENPTYDRIGSTRRFGVELETSRCENHRSIRGGTIWECKSDCSIEGKEFVSPILYGDQGLDEVIDFCATANRMRWRVNCHCGYHAHFDVENEDWQSLRSIAYAYRLTQNLWMQLVSADRAHNSYCGRVDYEADEVAGINSESDWEYFVGERDRFEYINWRAYLVHGSVELRLHDASLDATAINNWVMIHLRFIDYVKQYSIDALREKFMGDTDAQMEMMHNIIGNDLWEYYIEVASRNGNAFHINAVDVYSPPF